MAKVRHRKFGNTRQLRSGRWQARWEGSDGHSHTAPSTFDTQDAAELWLAAQVVDRAAGAWVDRRDGSIPFTLYAEAWAADVVHLRRSSFTRDVGYLRRYLIPRFGPTPIGDIDTPAVRRFVRDLTARGLAPATVSKAGQILSKVLGQAVADKRIGANPCAGVKLPRVERHDMITLTAPQVAELVDAIDPRHAPMVLLACWTGLRIGELVALTAGDIDTVRRRVSVKKAMTELSGELVMGKTKTYAGRRVVPMPPFVAEELAVYLEGKHPDDIAFPDTAGGYLRLSNFRSRKWRPATEAIGVPKLRIHDMRHTAVTLWLGAGYDPKTIAEWAGHSSVVTVLDRYGRAQTDANMDALDALGRPATRRGATITPIR